MAYTADFGGGLYAIPRGGVYPQPKVAQKVAPWAIPPTAHTGAYTTPGGLISGRGPVAENDPTQPPPTGSPYNPPGPSNPYNPPATPTPTTPTTPTTPKGTSPSTPVENWNPNTDPFVASLLVSNQQQAKTLGANLSQQARTALLGFGSKEIAQAVLNAGPFGYQDPRIDPATGKYIFPITNPMADLPSFLDAISDSPNSNSTLGQENWGYMYGGGPQGINSNIGYIPFNEQENENSLWYGGGRQYGLAQAGRQHLINIQNETTDFQKQLQGLYDQWQAAQGGFNTAYNNALNDAFTRHLTSGPGASGTPTTPAPSTPANPSPTAPGAPPGQPLPPDQWSNQSATSPFIPNTYDQTQTPENALNQILAGQVPRNTIGMDIPLLAGGQSMSDLIPDYSQMDIGYGPGVPPPNAMRMVQRYNTLNQLSRGGVI